MKKLIEQFKMDTPRFRAKQSHLRAQVTCCSQFHPQPQETFCSGTSHDGGCGGDAFPRGFRSHSQEVVLKSKKRQVAAW